jgi:hypothetical protein
MEKVETPRSQQTLLPLLAFLKVPYAREQDLDVA